MSKDKQNGKKPNIFFWFMGLMGKRLPIYLTAIVVSIVGFAGSKIANAWLVKNIMEAAQTRQTDGLLTTVIINFFIIVAAMFTWRFGIVRYNIEAKRGIARVEKQVFAKVLRLPMSYYENMHSGDFMSKLVFDMERAGDIYGSRLRRLLDGFLTTVIYMIPMLVLNWQLTLCLLSVSGLSLLVNSIFLKPMKKMGSKLSGKNAVMTEKITNILAGMETTKIFPTGRQLLEDYDVANSDCYKIQKKTNTMSAALEGLNNLFDLLSSLAFLGVGVWFVSKNLTTLGELSAIYSIYGNFRFVVMEIGKYIPQMMNCVANAERIYDFLSLEEEPETYELSGGADKTAGIVTAKDITFAYKEDRQILENLSLDIKKGEFVALTGQSGCGKSTFAKLLLGFYKPEQGDLTIEGKSYSEMSLREVRDLIGYVPQEPYLFEATIAENIAYGRSDVAPEDVPMEDIIEAAKAANAHDFIMKLPEGYNTIPGERGNTLSGGEKQRIAIARAVLKNAPVLLLDEATSALDNESERLVNEAIERLCKERTTIMIAHRASTIARADRVIAMGE
ncbi:MAG: ABC transporter ATP-binding protein [Lachnospiraceae bacterium]|nr:ABC transporter ATP-binding protein [Lachnospiraceae bacterium]